MIRKILLNQVDNGVLPPNFDKLDEKDILNAIKSEVIMDSRQEEKETVDRIGGKFGMYCIEQIRRIIRDIRDSEPVRR